jgi:hypothetical protein
MSEGRPIPNVKLWADKKLAQDADDASPSTILDDLSALKERIDGGGKIGRRVLRALRHADRALRGWETRAKNRKGDDDAT